MIKRPVRIEGDIAYVPLTQGYTAIIDAADVPLADMWNWCAHVQAGRVYAQRTDHSGPKKRKVYLHRAIMGDPDGFDVDHRDGDGLNNRRSNLRKATTSQNLRNQRIRSDNTSGLKCVSLSHGKWRARITVNGKTKTIGRFPTPEAAYAAYCKASLQMHGEFGRIV